MFRTEASPSGGRSLDLLAVSTLAVLGLSIVLMPGFDGFWYFQVPLGILLVLFLPGYALVSAVCPAAGPVGAADPVSAGAGDPDVVRRDVGRTEAFATDGAHDGPDAEGGFVMSGPTRVVLAMGLSAGGTPLVGMLLTVTPLGVAPRPTVVALGVLTVLLCTLAAARRHHVRADRFGVSLRRGTKRFRGAVRGRSDRETVLNLLLLTGLFVSMAGLGLAVATSDNGERYTEFYLLAEDPETGDLVADSYPQELVAGEPTELHLGIANWEGRTVDYTVVVQLERLEGPAGNQTVTERARLDTVELTLRNGRTTEFPRSMEPVLQGEGLRLTYLLYVGPPPENPGTDTAHRSVHLWIDVGPPKS